MTTTDLSAAAAEFKRLRDAATPDWHQAGSFCNTVVGPCGQVAGFCDSCGAAFAVAARSCDLPERIEQLVARVQELEAIVTKAQRLFSVCEFSEPIDLTELDEIMECAAFTPSEKERT